MKVYSSKVLAAAAKLVFLSGVLFFSVNSLTAQTQAAGADLTGSVTDPSGAVVANAISPGFSSTTEALDSVEPAPPV